MKLLLKRSVIFSLFLLAVGFLGCEDDEINGLPQVVAQFVFEVDEGTGTVAFTNVSEKADSYEWDFGNGTKSTEINPTVTYTTGTYTVSLTAKNVAGASDTFTDELVIVVPNPITLPITFDDANVDYDVSTFGGVAFQIVDNPAPGGSNDQASQVGEITNSGEAFEGFFFDLGTALDLTNDKTVTINFWSEAPIDVLLKLEQGTGADAEIPASHGGTGWEELSFDFTSSAAYSRLTFFVDGPGTTAGTFYIDDIQQTATSGGGGGPELATSFPIGFETNETLSGVFEEGDGVTGAIIDNPDQSGINPSAKVYEFNKAAGAAWYSGLFHVFPSDIDLNTTQAVTFKIWSPKAGINVRVQLEKEGGGGGPTVNIDQTLATANEWVSLTYDFAGLVNVADAYDKFVIFPDFDDVAQAPADGSVYYFDDIEQGTGSGGGGGPEVATSFPIGFEANETLSGVFEEGDGVTGVPIANPDQSGVNTSATVFEFNKVNGAAWYSGLFQIFPSDIDLSTTQAITFKMWSPKAGINVRVQLEKEGGGGGPTVNIDQTIATANQWVELTYDFAGLVNVADAYDKFVVFPDFDDVGQPAGDGSIYYFDDFEQGTGSGGGGPEAATSLPVDFENNETFSGVFEEGDGVTGVPIANPDQSGINTSATVFEFNKANGAAWYSGMFNIFPSNIDLNAGTEFTVKVWSPKAGVNVRMQLEKEGGGGGPTLFVDQTIATANTWVELTYDFSGSINVADAYDKIVIFPDFDDVGQPAGDGSIYYVDDLAQSAPATPPSFATSYPIGFEANETLSGVFEEGDGVTGVPIANPDQSGINTTATVFEFNKVNGAAWYSGLFHVFPSNIDLNAGTSFTFKIWSPKAGVNVRMQLEKEGGGGGPTVNIDQTVASANTWVELTYDFSGLVNVADAYDKFVVFPDFDDVGQPAGDGSIYYLDDFDQVAPATPPSAATSLPMTFESNETFSGVFEEGDGVTGVPIANPDQSGINTSATVFEFNKVNGAAWYSGMFNVFPSDLDLNSGTTFTVKVWSPKAGINVRFQLEKEGGGGGPTLFVDQTLATANTWVELSYDFSGSINVADAYDKIVIFPDFDDVGQPAGDGSIYYVDDVVQVAGGGGGGCPPPPAGELLSNGGFEANGGDGACWQLNDGGGSVTIIDTDANSGTYSARMITGPTNVPNLKQERFAQSIAGSQDVQVTFRYKVTQAFVDGAILQVIAFSEFTTDPAQANDLGNADVSTVDVWQTYTGTFTTAANIEEGISLLIQATCGGAGTCAGEVIIDDVVVTEL